MPGLEETALGHYRLLRRLGYGGMSEVYLARDEHTDRTVALKVVSSSHMDYIARFQREVEAIGKLHHSNILPAFDYGEQGTWCYLVMPYMEQGTLRELLDQYQLTLEEAGELLRQIASGLQYAHDQGIIHRDIKPSNILLRQDGHVYLADFGLAKSLEGANELTQMGSLLGTPEYMAPELAEGPATTSSDIYSLSVLLYQIVTGRVPFTAETPVAVYWKQIRDQPEPPSHFNPDVTSAIEQVILRALEKDPRRRYQTAAELAEAYTYALETGTSPDFNEMPPLYDLTPVEDADASFVTPEEAIQLALQQEERLVLPADPVVAPTAVAYADEGAAPIDHASLPAQSLYQEAPLIPVTPDPVYIPPSRRAVRRYRRRTNRVLVGFMIGIVFLVFIVLIIVLGFVYINNQAHDQGSDLRSPRPQVIAAASVSSGFEARAFSVAGGHEDDAAISKQ